MIGAMRGRQQMPRQILIAAFATAYVFLTALGPSWADPIEALLFTDRPQKDQGAEIVDYLRILESKVGDEFESRQIPHYSMKTLTKSEMHDLIKNKKAKYVFRADLSAFDTLGLKIEIKCRQVSIVESTGIVQLNDFQPNLYSIYTAGMKTIGEHYGPLRAILDDFFWVFGVRVEKGDREVLLADCISLESDGDDQVGRLTRKLTVKYPRLLRDTEVGQTYYFVGVDHKKYQRWCISTDSSHQRFRAYDHMLSGYLTDMSGNPGIVLLWEEEGKTVRDREIEFGTDDQSTMAELIKQGFLELASEVQEGR
ncbi:MAG: hypothetical protein IMF18_14450 [Proteobacteria bacterium]|nr:hypothetical protein [Pseudomonadota bacterium]